MSSVTARHRPTDHDAELDPVLLEQVAALLEDRRTRC